MSPRVVAPSGFTPIRVVVTAAVASILLVLGVLGTGDAAAHVDRVHPLSPVAVAGVPDPDPDADPDIVPGPGVVADPGPGVVPGRDDDGSDRVAIDEPADPDPDRVPLVVVPAGCLAPALPDIVFVGTVVDRDYRTVRFVIDQIRAGSEESLAVDGVIDVRYGLDAQYLDLDGEYLVSARRDPLLGVLASRVREPAPEFGGDDIVSIDQSDVQCPELEDPIRTLQVDGRAVPASVLAPLLDSRPRVLGAVLIPVGVAFGLIFVLAMLRLGVSGTIRGLRSLTRRSRRWR